MGHLPAKGLLLSSLAFVAIAVFSVGLQLWFWRRIVCEFNYDGRVLRFRTLGIPGMQSREMSDIADLRDWRGRGGSVGYRLRFANGEKVYLQYGVSNSDALAEEIRTSIGK